MDLRASSGSTLLQETRPILASLLDMLTFYAVSFSMVIGALRSAVCSLSFMDTMHVRSSVNVAESWKIVETSLDELAEHSTELPLSFSVSEQIKRVREAAKNAMTIMSSS